MAKKLYLVADSILLTTGGKIKNAQNHRQIDARGAADPDPGETQASVLFFLIPFAESNIFVKTSGRKNLLFAGV